MAEQRDEVEVCIVDGANICPPEPLELVWTCITTGLLAGSECPEVEDSDAAANAATVSLRTVARPEPEWCRCVYKCATAGFFVDPQVDPLASDGGLTGNDDHCRAWATLNCVAQNKNLYAYGCRS